MEDVDLIETYRVFENMIALSSSKYTFGISNLETIIYVQDGIGMGVKQDQKVLEGSVIFEAISTAKPAKRMVTAEQNAYGDEEYVAIATPIFKNGEMVGAMTWCVTTDSVKLASTAEELLSLSEELSATGENFAQNSMHLAESNEHLTKQVEELKAKMKEIENINEMVTELAMESRILGINAAIESGKAGEYGIGFSVVADEIRRLATESKQSAKEISQNINGIEASFTEISAHIEQVAGTSEEQAASAQELLAAIVHVRTLATNLENLAESSGAEQIEELARN